jgi:hypothetical protein
MQNDMMLQHLRQMRIEQAAMEERLEKKAAYDRREAREHENELRREARDREEKLARDLEEARASGPSSTNAPPPKLDMKAGALKFDVWHIKWEYFLESSGINTIKNEAARKKRARALLQQSFTDDTASWVNSQVISKEDAGDPAKVIKMLREKVTESVNPKIVFVELMNRLWDKSESADDFWIDIQARIRLCQLNNAAIEDWLLSTIWAKNFTDPDVQRRINQDPSITAVQCWKIAQEEERAKKAVKIWQNPIQSQPVQAISTYKRGGPRGRGGQQFGRGGHQVGRGGQRPHQSQPTQSSTDELPANPDRQSRPRDRSQSRPRGQFRPRSQSATRNWQVQDGQCMRCGLERHGQGQNCPAFDQLCSKCGKKGHYGRMCQTRWVNNTDDD